MKTEYQEVDFEGLATCLAEEAWKAETKNESEDELYEMVLVHKDGEVDRLERQIKPHWASAFFVLRDGYLRLINHYKKPA